MNKRLLLYSFFIILSFTLTTCAKQPSTSYKNSSETISKETTHDGLEALKHGNFKKSREYFSEGLRQDPTNCRLNFLNALSYQLEGRTNVESLQLAEVGYRHAIQFCPQDPWPRYFYGLIMMSRKNYEAAENLFKSAAATAKDEHIVTFLDSYLVAAYDAGDDSAANKILHQLEGIAPNDPVVAKLKAQLEEASEYKDVKTKKALAQQKAQFEAEAKKMAEDAASKTTKRQVVVDGVIILHKEKSVETRGLNLMKGLQLQFGSSSAAAYSNVKSKVGMSQWGSYFNETNLDGSWRGSSYPAMPFTEAVTKVITMPAVTYDLNIFNSNDQQDEILARPTLLVEDGKTADYFSGRILILGITGSNAGTIQKFPLGVFMKISPSFLPDGSIDMAIDIGRELLTAATGDTTFSQEAEALSENTNTNVNLHFGETAILSALSENIEGETSNRVPVLGEIPLIKYLFNREVKTVTHNSVLILLTPQPYVSFANESIVPKDEELYRYYHSLIEPATNIKVLLEHLRHIEIYKREAVMPMDFYNQQVIEEAVQEEYLKYVSETELKPYEEVDFSHRSSKAVHVAPSQQTTASTGSANPNSAAAPATPSDSGANSNSSSSTDTNSSSSSTPSHKVREGTSLHENMPNSSAPNATPSGGSS